MKPIPSSLQRRLNPRGCKKMHRNCSTYTTCKFSGLKRKREVSENNDQRPTKRSIFGWQRGATRRTEIRSATYITHKLIGSKRMRDNSTQASEDSGKATVEETAFNSSTPTEQYKEMCTSRELEGRSIAVIANTTAGVRINSLMKTYPPSTLPLTPSPPPSLSMIRFHGSLSVIAG
ncbi:hypothetical protein TWF706_000649, partial [Orbilia oligospora]